MAKDLRISFLFTIATLVSLGGAAAQAAVVSKTLEEPVNFQGTNYTVTLYQDEAGLTSFSQVSEQVTPFVVRDFADATTIVSLIEDLYPPDPVLPSDPIADAKLAAFLLPYDIFGLGVGRGVFTFVGAVQGSASNPGNAFRELSLTEEAVAASWVGLTPVPEPLSILGTVAAAGIGYVFRCRKLT